MGYEQRIQRVAIVGFGPRGLGALEALASQVIDLGAKVDVDLFDPFPWPGAGPNYDPDQSKLCILNIPLRTLDIDPPAFLAGQIGSFADWSSTSFQPEDFPPRSAIGAYLHERFKTLIDTTSDLINITHNAQLITGLERCDDGWWLSHQGMRHGPYDEVLLTQGQPETAPDPQLARWMEHARDHKLELLPAYPANSIVAAAKEWAGKTIAIRGLGLSTFDVLRMLTTGLGGRFNDQSYTVSGAEPHKILPFSLDGRPPAPKPATEAIDRNFDLTDSETEMFRGVLKDALREPREDALKLICSGVVTPAARLLDELGSENSKADVRFWLEVERTDAGSQETIGALDTLKLGIEMAYGRCAPSIGYAVAQIWRKWEGIIRDAFNAAAIDAEISSAIVEFDENLKRFSAGPPVSASEELLALVGCGLVSLCTVDDPAIVLGPNGWQLLNCEGTLTASIMINAVLPTPNIAHVTDRLVVLIADKGFGQSLSEGRGLKTRADGQLVGRDGTNTDGLSALGRLALGSVIAVDSLHDCFGKTTQKWAASVLERTEMRAAGQSEL